MVIDFFYFAFFVGGDLGLEMGVGLVEDVGFRKEFGRCCLVVFMGYNEGVGGDLFGVFCWGVFFIES